MPDQYQSDENYMSYDQQQQQSMYCPSDCNQCTPTHSGNYNQQAQGYYDCTDNESFNLAGQDFSEYCDQNYQCEQPEGRDDICMESGEGNMQAVGDEGCNRPCSDSCQLPMCSPYKKRRYIQPPRRQSFKPLSSYRKPLIPMATETIYRKSFEGIDTNTASCCRAQAVNPPGVLRTPNGPFSKETVTRMSFQPFCGVERVRPIYPQSRSLLGKGPIQGLTTQKHDFVPKFQYRRSKIYPRDNISKSCGNFEKCTVQKLSFQPHCGVSRTESFKPVASYRKPNVPMEFNTTQKLSFMPVCIAPKDEMPWARKTAYQPPTVPFAKETVTKLSYQSPGCFVDDDYSDPCQQICPENYRQMPSAAC